jgi:1,2-diacylglycerol 3-alpha-glucosyltransferase
MTRVGILFDSFGPYHLARLEAAARVCELLAIEGARCTDEYAWEPSLERRKFRCDCLCYGTSRDISHRELSERLDRVLQGFQPSVVAVPGWASRLALSALAWCISNRVPAVIMTESQFADEPRMWWKEYAKRKVVALCSSGLAGGRPQSDYLAQLGMAAERVSLGYDAVENDYFARVATEVRSRRSEAREQFRLPENFFLAVARFIPKKNLANLLSAFARYRTLVPEAVIPWSLVLLGDGPLRATLDSQLAELKLQSHVRMPGFEQYRDLPAYYGLANAFIHASSSEQWGLVVNEAMASGLPVLVSKRCGCALDLVQEGVNGYTFDPLDTEGLAQLMLKVASPGFPLAQFRSESRRYIAGWGLSRFAQGLATAVQMALHVGPIRSTFMQRVALRALLAR